MKLFKLNIIFIKNNKKKMLLIFGLLVVLSVFFKILLNILPEYKDYQFDKNYLYIENSNIDLNQYEYENTFSLLPIKSISNEIEYPYELELKLKIDDIEFNKNTSAKTLSDVNNLYTSSEKVISLPLVYNLNNDYINSGNIDVPNYEYNVDHVIVGNYPKSNEVMIGEVYANYLMGKLNLKKYDELVGQKINIKTKECNDECIDSNLKISGVYKSQSLDEPIENIIIGVDDNIKNKILENIKEDDNQVIIKFDNKKDKKKFIKENNNLEVYDSEYFKKINYQKYLKIIYIVLINIIILFIFKKEFKTQNKILTHYKNKKVTIIFSFSLLFILSNLIIFIMIK